MEERELKDIMNTKPDVVRLGRFVTNNPGYSITVDNHLDNNGFPQGPPDVTVTLNGKVVEQHES